MKKPHPKTVCWNCPDRHEHCAVGCKDRARELEEKEKEYRRRRMEKGVSDTVWDLISHRNTKRRK